MSRTGESNGRRTASSRAGRLRYPTPAAWPAVDWMELLTEGADDEQSQRELELWALVRRVQSWAQVNDLDWKAKDPLLGQREPLEYRRAANPSVALADVLPHLADLSGQQERAQILRATLGLSCWAESSGKLLLSLRLAEAAAACDPFDPAPANVSGRLSRVLGRPLRADEWYSRAVGLARRRRWSACYVRAHVGYGTLHKEIGRTSKALDLLSRAAWRAQKSGIKWLAGEVLHDMLLLALSSRAFRDAEECAARALAVYPKHHDRVPALVHDFALLCTREGAFELAFPLLKQVIALVRVPHERLIVWSTLALSAAGAGDRESYEEASTNVRTLVETYPQSAPPALMNLALAAQVRRELNVAGFHAQSALRLADGNPIYAEQVRDAKVLLRNINAAVPISPGEKPARANTLRPLYDNCSHLIARWRGRSWREARHQTRAGAFGRA